MQKFFQREDLRASREEVIAYMDENHLQPEEVVVSISHEVEKILLERNGHLRQGQQKSLPCYQNYKDTVAIASITYASCLVYSGLAGSGLVAGSCSVAYLISLYAADVAYNTCIDEI